MQLTKPQAKLLREVCEQHRSVVEYYPPALTHLWATEKGRKVNEGKVQ